MGVTSTVVFLAQQVDQGDIFDEAADPFAAVIVAGGSAAESYVYDESGSATATASGSGTESLSYGESATATATASGTGVEAFQPPIVYADSGSAAVAASGSGTESSSTSDSSSSFATASGTGTEAAAYDDSRSATATASGTGIEAFPIAYTDSGSATATASGIGTESLVYGESASATATASGSGIEVYQPPIAYSTPTPYDLVLDADNPVSHWKLGGTTTAVDRKGTLNLPAGGGPISSVAGLLANNDNDPGNTFTATQRFGLNPATGRGAPYNTANWTVEAWVKPTAFGALQVAVRRNAGQGLLILSGGELRFEVQANGGSNVLTLLNSAVLGTVYHAVAVCDGTTVIAYLNGIEKARLAVTTLGSYPDEAPTIGAITSSGGQPFTGTVDEVSWYSTALSPLRVMQHYQAGLPGTFYSDSRSGTVTVSGSGVDAQVCGDSATINTPGLYDATVDVDTPVSHWKLGDAVQAVDRKGVQNLQAVGASPTTARGLVANESGEANAFDGARDPAIAQRFSVPPAVGVGTPYNTPTWSLEVWIKADSVANDPDVVRRSGGPYIWLTSSGQVVWSGATGNSSAGSVRVGRTTHLVLTFDGATARGYVDGESISTFAATSLTSNSAPVIGSRFEGGASNGTFKGTIDEVAWYSTALSTARIQAHYRAGLRYEIGSSGTGTESTTYDDSRSAVIAASGSGTESYQTAFSYDDSGSATVVASGSGAESYSTSDASSSFAAASGTGVESAAYDDSRSATATASGTRVESVAYSDSGSAAVTASGSAAQSFTHSASGSATAVASGTGVESASYADSRSAAVVASGSGVEVFQPPITYTDSRAATVIASGDGSESYETAAGYEDSGSGTIAASGTVVESFAHSAAASGAATASGTATEAAVYGDSGSATVAASGTGTESVAHADSASATVTASGAGVEAAVYADSRTGAATATGTSVEVAYAGDSGAATASAGGAGVESIAYADSASAAAVASGSGTESYETTTGGYEDAGSGTVTTTGSGVESIVYTDSRAGTLTASGTGFEGDRGRAWIVTGGTHRLNTTGVAGSVGRVLIVTGLVQRPDERSAAGLVTRVGPGGQGPVDRPATIETGSIEWATTSP
jgi:hypothetical protein